MAIGEEEIAVAVMRIAAAQANKIASYGQLRRQIPRHVALGPDDVRLSGTRPNEPMWHQIFRNIKSHFQDEGNAIAEGYLEHVPRVGYRITAKGETYIARFP